MQSYILLQHAQDSEKGGNRLGFIATTVAILVRKDGRPLTQACYADRVTLLRGLTAATAREAQVSVAKSKGVVFVGELTKAVQSSKPNAFRPGSSATSNVKDAMIELFGNGLCSQTASLRALSSWQTEVQITDVWRDIKPAFQKYLQEQPNRRTSLLLVDLPLLLGRTLQEKGATDFTVGPHRFSLVGVLYWNKNSSSIASGVINTSENGGSEWWRYEDASGARVVGRTSGAKLALPQWAGKQVFILLFRCVP
jgi:hypothetical protein